MNGPAAATWTGQLLLIDALGEEFADLSTLVLKYGDVLIDLFGDVI